jgi:hypothetical protein
MKKILLILAGFAISCNDSSNSTAHNSEKDNSEKQMELDNVRGIVPPSVELMPVPHVLSISNVENGGSFELSERIKISIPSNAFVDAAGKPVVGKVDLKYVEYFDAVDILLSGIPMEYDSAGADVLQSAGMFEINGSQGDKQIRIADGKSLSVDMNSTSKAQNYNLYAFDKSTQKWDYLQPSPIVQTQTSTLKKITESTNSNLPIKNSEPIRPGLYKKGEPVLDLEINTQSYPELQSFKSLVWQFAPQVPTSERESANWIYNEHWNNIALEANGDFFTLNLKNASKNFTTKIVPVVDVQEYKAVTAMLKNSEKEKMQREQAAKNESLISNLNASTLRTFGITTFGIYNCDRIFRSEAMTVNSEFSIQGSSFKPTTIYVVNASSNTVYRYSDADWTKVKLLPNDEQMILTFLKDGKIAGIKPKDLKAITQQKPSSYSFTLFPFPEDQLSVASLKKNAGI